MKHLAFTLVLLAPLAASAQPAPHTFVPYTVTEQQHQAILNFLGDVPSKYAVPLISDLNQMERAAQATQAAADKAKEKAAEKNITEPVVTPK